MIKVFNMNLELIKIDWYSTAMAAENFRLPRGKLWADFIYKTDDHMVLAE